MTASLSLASHLPIVPVLLPLLAAAACALTRCRHTAWLIATLATWGVFLAALLLGVDSQPLSYALGGHTPPTGIEYALDGLNRYMLLILAFIGAVMIPYAKTSVMKSIPGEKQSLFYATYLLCLAGLIGITLTGDLFNIYVFIEISSLSIYTLIALGRDRQALVAAIEYLIIGTIGATFFLIGVGFLYIMTGTLNLADMAVRLPDVADSRAVEAGFVFILLGLFMKLAAFPLHVWLVNAYAYAPSFISAFLAATATKVMAYLFIRLSYSLFGHSFAFDYMPLVPLLMTAGVAGIVVGSLTAVYQMNVKRMLAFSSIAQVGYILLGLGLATEAGLAASITHLANHALAKGALFMAVGCVVFRTGGNRMEHFAGIGRVMPWTMTAFILAGLSLIGVPGTAGFISKWYLLTALLEAGYWPLVILMLISSLLAVVYIWRVVDEAFFHKPLEHEPYKEAPLALLIPTWILVLANFWFGFDTRFTADAALSIAAMLMAGG